MNHNDPLTPDERELARLLGRTERAPSAAIDDAILAAARIAVGASAEAAGPGAAQSAVPLLLHHGLSTFVTHQ